MRYNSFVRHLIHITRTASNTQELTVPGATTLVRYRALEREIPDELAETLQRGQAVDHLRDEHFLASEIAHSGDPEVAIALGFAIGACAAYARQQGATIEALVELDLDALDVEQRAKVDWLLTTLRNAVGPANVHLAPPTGFLDRIQAAVGQQQN